MIYEARPNVTVDAAVLAVRSGNAAILEIWICDALLRACTS